MNRLVDKNEMQLIYDYCIRVYGKELSANAACNLLAGKTNASPASLKMYFVIYASMRKGFCYKMGTSAAFTRFLIEKIYEDNGYDAFLIALASAKQNAEYRIACGNEQPGIEETCRALINEHATQITYEELNRYYAEKSHNVNTRNTIRRNTSINNTEMCISIKYGGVSFEAKGTVETVLTELQSFSNQVLVKTVASVKKRILLSQSRSNGDSGVSSSKIDNCFSEKDTNNISVGKRICESHPEIKKLVGKKDFKARMIPLLFLSDEEKYQDIFSIHDIQLLMKDAIEEYPEKKQIEDVFFRRQDWFEKVCQNPRKYKLLNIAKDYARNILNE